MIAALPLPEGSSESSGLALLWQAATLLREHRGDGHLAALTAAGLTGIEALITHTATGAGFVPEFAMVSRGWTRDDWDAGVAGLAQRGLLAADDVGHERLSGRRRGGRGMRPAEVVLKNL